MDIKNLTDQCFVETIPGFTAKIFAVCSCDIETWPALKTTTGTGDKITLNGDIVLKTGKKFAEIALIPDSGKLTETEVGVVGSMNFQAVFEAKIAKNIASDEWMALTKNGCWVFIVKDKDGNSRVLGTNEIPATRTATVGNNGPDLASEKTWTVTITDNTGKIPPYYEGEIDLTGA